MDVAKTLNALRQSVQSKGQTPADKNPRLWKAVKDFESILIYQMLKAMRETISDSGLTEAAPGRDFFESMFDEKISGMIAGRQQSSLAEMLYRQLSNAADAKNTEQTESIRPVKHSSPSAVRAYRHTSLTDRLKRIRDLVDGAAERHQVDRNLIFAVIAQESAGDPAVVSSKGAKGLMQLMDETAADLGVKRVMNPLENVMAGTRYLRMLLDKYNGNIELALAGYNAGPGAVQKYNGIPPYKETQQYVKKVMNYYRQFSQSSIL